MRAALEQALAADDPPAVAAVVAANPRFLEGGPRSATSGDVIERYAAYRVGYHRGLDALPRLARIRLRALERSGNRGFLRSLRGSA